MYLNILKKDLKRKKTMNLIILVFVILASMFFSSSVNNIVSVAGGIDHFLDIAGMKDCFVVISEPDESDPLGKILDENSRIKSYSKETFLLCTSDMLRHNDSAVKGLGSMSMVIPAEKMADTCFDENNQPISSVEPGKVIITASLADKSGISVGDTLTFDMYGTSIDLEMTGICKDAIFGSDMTDSPRFIISQEDFDTLYSNETVRLTSRCNCYLIETDDPDAVAEIASSSDGCLIHGDRNLLKLTFIISITVAAILMVVSVFLILIAFVVVRFTIGFTIQEEFREIGVMKAIGIKNSSIRVLYLVKYLGIAVLGSVIGFFASVPFGRMMLDSVSRSMVLENESPVLTGVICSAAVVALILIFCWRSTANVKKLSPIDAVRNGQTGERFRKHCPLSLSRSRLSASGFLPVSHILSNPRQTVILTTVFTLCALMVMILSNTARTLSSGDLVYIIGTTQSDAYIDISSGIREVQNGLRTLDDVKGEMEQILSENGMPGKVILENLYNVNTEFDGKSSTGRFFLCRDTKCSDYIYSKGTPPRYPNEVALGCVTANDLGAEIGDTVEITINGEKKPFVVTAVMDSMSNVGRCGRFHESLEIPDEKMSVSMAFQVNFDDHPDQKTIEERIEKLKDIYSTERIYDSSGYVDDCTKAGGAISGVKTLTMLVSLIIIMLISVLIERSFISKEKGEIALQKAMGFTNGSVIFTHVLRFLIITALSVGISALLSVPATKLAMDPLFGLLGAVSGLDYAVDPAETFVKFPVILLAAVAIGVFLTALSTNRIKASDTADIE